MALTTENDYRMLPKYLISKRAILNPRNNDYCSFGYAIMFAFHPKDWKIYALNTETDNHFIQHGLDKINYPVLIDEIPLSQIIINV